MLTRARRRRGERYLWDMIVNNDDICSTHILPRLNQTDIKFLYDVNSETRALIKRAASSGITLEEKFKIEEMSSISTLEFAWKNVRWGEESRHGYGDEIMDQAWFCKEVAWTNKLELLKWVREEKKCKWDAMTSMFAAFHGNLEMLKYCVANKCPGFDASCCGSAVQGGQLECLKYLHEELRAPWDCATAWYAAQGGHLHILEYLVERKYNNYSTDACENAAMNGHLDCLKYLHETAKAPWDAEAVRYAHENNRSECLQYLLDKNCPLPEGWRYEHGELHVPEE
jgi:hypothetical protein